MEYEHCQGYLWLYSMTRTLHSLHPLRRAERQRFLPVRTWISKKQSKRQNKKQSGKILLGQNGGGGVRMS